MRVDIKGFKNVVDAPIVGNATLSIHKATNKKTKSGSDYLQLTYKILDCEEQKSGMDPLGKYINAKLYYPHPGQKDGGDFCALLMRKFVNCFGVPEDEDGFDDADLHGLEGEVILVNQKNEYQGKVTYDNTVGTYISKTANTPDEVEGWGK